MDRDIVLEKIDGFGAPTLLELHRISGASYAELSSILPTLIGLGFVETAFKLTEDGKKLVEANKDTAS